jgi:hypothetical protein
LSDESKFTKPAEVFMETETFVRKVLYSFGVEAPKNKLVLVKSILEFVTALAMAFIANGLIGLPDLLASKKSTFKSTSAFE